MRNNLPKVKNKHLIFKTSITRVKTYLLVDNRNKTELIDKFFVHANKILLFKLQEFINLILRNRKIVQKLIKKPLANIIIEDHIE